MDKYHSDGDKMSTNNTYGFSTAELLVRILRQCGDDLSRENLMRQAANIKAFVPSLALPVMSITTSPTDVRINKQMMKFDGECWQPFGPIIEDTGGAG